MSDLQYLVRHYLDGEMQEAIEKSLNEAYASGYRLVSIAPNPEGFYGFFEKKPVYQPKPGFSGGGFGGGGRSSGPRDPNSPVSEKQVKYFYVMLKQSGVTHDAMRGYMKSFGLMDIRNEDIARMNKAQFEAALNWMKTAQTQAPAPAYAQVQPPAQVGPASPVQQAQSYGPGGRPAF